MSEYPDHIHEVVDIDDDHDEFDRLLQEALTKTDEEVAASLIAKGYDLDELDRQLIGLIDRLPPYQP